MAADNDPFDRVVATLAARGSTIRRPSPDRVRATCPAHSDAKPSLVVTRGEGKVLMKCFAGCSNRKIVAELGLRWTDLFIGPRTSQQRGAIVACYDYLDRCGALVAQKVRSESKAFAWRRSDPSARGGFRWGLEGLSPGLYGWPKLIGASVVYVVEGEKGADRLTSLGLVATCGSAGANGWKPRWSADLLEAASVDAEIVILPDNDRVGARHAEKVATDVHAHRGDKAIVVKIVPLAGLPPSGDVVDWLDADHTRDELLESVTSAPAWLPGAEGRRQAEIRKAHHRDRMRRYRAALRGGGVPNLTTTAVQSDANTISAIVAVLDAAGEPCSWRRISTATMADGHARRAVTRALADGVSTGVLAERGGDRRGRAKLYSRAAEGRGVTTPAHSPLSFTASQDRRTHLTVRRVTRPAHSKSAPHDRGADESTSAVFVEQTSVRQCAVTPCAVTQGERSSSTLQETRDPPRHSPVTGSGALPSAGSVTAKTLEELRGGAAHNEGDGRVPRCWCRRCQPGFTDVTAAGERGAR